MGLGSVVVLDVLLRLRDLTAFYTDDGVFPRAVLVRQSWLNPSYNLFLSSGTTEGQFLLFCLLLATGAALAAGWHSRWAGLACWYLLSSVQLRNPVVLDGGDDLLRLVLFWTPFLPVGARWSLDARRHPEWSRLPSAHFSLATVGYVLQICLLYGFAGLHKSDPVWRQTGDALYYTLSIDQFATGLAHWLVLHPDWLRPMTFGALAVELALPLLLLCPWRPGLCRSLALPVAWGFHLAVASMLHLGLFMPIACICLLGLVPGSWLGRTEDPGEPLGFRLGWLAQTFLALTLVYIVGMNVRSLSPNPGRQSLPLLWFGALTHEGQNWQLFAPHPFRDDGWFWIEGTLPDGRTVDLLGGPIKPGFVSAQFPNQRWRRWLQNLRQGYPDLRESYLDELAREHGLASVRLTYMEETTPPPGQTAPITPHLLLERTYRRPGAPMRLEL